MKCFIFFAFIFLFFGKVGYGQNTSYTDVNLASPTAASLGKFGDIPVSYHTGIPAISVPIYTVKEGTLSLPIDLSYHAAGIKTMDPSGWVGTGWALSAGGVISRTMRGAPDERNTSNAVKGHFSDYGFSNYLTYLGGTRCIGTGTQINDYQFANALLDGEPDLFSFNFNGYSGKFYFNDDRTPVIVDGQDIKIEYYYTQDTAQYYTALSANIQGFTLTVSNGDKYYFGINPGGSAGGASPVEITFPYSVNNTNVTDRIFSSWYLTKIVSADGMFTINLTYQAESYSYYTLSMFPVEGSLNSTYNYEYNLVKMFIEGVRLDQVLFSNGSATFTPSGTLRTDLGNSFNSSIGFDTDDPNTEAKALSGISIKNNGGFCKKYNFYYSYFADNSGNPLTGHLNTYPAIQTDKYRLKLDSLKEQSCDNSITVPPYKFNYYSNFLPRRLTFAQDHWGFYNDALNSTLIPTYSVDTFHITKGANRDPKWPEMENGILTKITYPAGGFDTLEFEPNTTWINAMRYDPVDRNTYSVGFDGSNSNNIPNIAFSANHYQVVINNPTCPSGFSGCTANVKIVSAGNVTYGSVTAGENESDTLIFTAPAGNYTVQLWRSAVQSGTGAQAYFTEIIPSQYQANAIVGGLRIKAITKNNGINKLDNNVTTFSYDVSGQSSGILYNRPSYVQLLRSDVVAKFDWSPACSNSTINNCPNGCSSPENWGPGRQNYLKSPCAIIPMASTQGNHIGYNEVKVTQPGNGYSIYRYYGSGTWDNVISDIVNRNVNPGVCLSSIPSMPANPVAFEYKRGLLKFEGHFNQSGQILKDAYYSYDFDSTKISTPALNTKYVLGALLGNSYELRGYWKKQTQTIAHDYSSTGTGTTDINTVYFESAFHHLPTRKENLSSSGEILSNKFKYAADFRIANCDTISDCTSTYNAACSACDATFNTATYNCGDLGCKFWAYIDNILCRANARVNFINSRKVRFTNKVNNFGTCILNAKSGADANLKPILELQTKFINVPIETTTWRAAKLLNASYTKYDYSLNPSTSVYPKTTQKINLASTISSFVTSSNTNSVLTKDSRYADESSFTFNLGNLTYVIPHDGIANSYIWDYFNTQPIAKVTNAAINQIAYTSFEADGKGNWTFTGAPSTDATSPAGSKCYSLASGSISKTGLTSTGKYIVSLWIKTGASVSLTGGTSTLVTGKTINSWTYKEYTVTGATTITVSGSGSIDELRLYPSNAQMATYTYSPLLGVTSACDADNKITYYFYDNLGRLKWIKDQDGNIIKTIQYHYKGIPGIQY